MTRFEISLGIYMAVNALLFYSGMDMQAVAWGSVVTIGVLWFGNKMLGKGGQGGVE